MTARPQVREVKAVLSAQPELKRKLPDMSERAKARVNRIRAEEELQRRALDEMKTDLQRLAELVSGQPGLGRAISELGLGDDEER